MKLIIRNVIMLSVISAIFAFYYVPYNTVTDQEKLQEITEKISTELSIIKKKGNQPRALSNELIQEISSFANSCKLEKIMLNDLETAESYSLIKGKLLQALLNRQLSPATYKKIFELVSFQGAFLENATLKNTNLSRVQLSRSYLVGADLSNTNLEGANLYRTELSQANLSTANLQIANLREATFKNTILKNATLKNAYLIDAKINRSIIDNTNLEGANLSGTELKKQLENSQRIYAKL